MRKLFFNVPIDILSKEEALINCQKAIQGEKCSLMYFINAHCFNMAQIDKHYLEILHKADLVLNDGIGMKLGSLFAKLKFKDNLNGTDLIPQIISASARFNKKIYLLGGKPGVAILAQKELERQIPGIKIVGTQHGYFSSNDPEVVFDINRSKADILIVGMGVPLQELWVHEIKNELNSVKLCIAGGAIIDFISGHVKRAPYWIRRANLEWMYRLIQEPHRLWRRYVLGNFKFFWNILYLFLLDRKQSKELNLNYSKVKP